MHGSRLVASIIPAATGPEIESSTQTRSDRTRELSSPFFAAFEDGYGGKEGRTDGAADGD